MVTNSDEDDDSSSSSLEDLDEMISLKRVGTREAHQERVHWDTRGEIEAPRRTSRRSEAVATPPLAARFKEHQFSLAILAEQQRDLQTSEEDVARINALLDARKQIPTASGHTDSMRTLPDESVIDAVMNDRGDEEDVDRLKHAIRRTEALHHDKKWSFFHARPEPEVAKFPDFPELQISPLRTILQDQRSRQHAFLTGFVEDYALRSDLSDGLVSWILDSICLEKRQDLRSSYVHVLQELGLRKDGLLNPQSIDSLLRKLGANEEALDMKKPITPRFTVSTDRDTSLESQLECVLSLICTLAGTLDPETTERAICVICRLLLDHYIMSNCSLVMVIAETLNNLIESVPDSVHEPLLQNVLPTIYGSVDDLALRLQFVQNLPAYTRRTALFRRRLALAFFFTDEENLHKSEEAPKVDLQSMATYLQTPRFAITKTTDFADLVASMGLLNIAIDNGGPVPLSTNSEEVRQFDSAVDLLSMRLRQLSARIVGASALNMRRTEAKEIIDAIQRRLSYTVRSRPPPKNTILADSAAGHAAERNLMAEYLDHDDSKAVSGSFVDIASVNKEMM